MTDINLKKTVASSTTSYDLFTPGLQLDSSSVLLAPSTTDTAGEITSTNTQNFAFTPGLTLVASINGAANATATFAATAGTMTDTTSYPVADQDTKNFTITVDGGSAQTVTVAGVTTSALHVAAQINAQVTGATADGSSGQVVVTSDTFGTGSTVAFGAGTSGLTFAAATAGTGDVVSIAAVTGAEIKTVFEADVANSTVTVRSDDVISFASTATGATKSIQFDSTGTANTIVGLDVLLHSGTDGYTPAYADILCYDTADSNLHKRYNSDISTVVIMGVVDKVTTDDAGEIILSYVKHANVHYGALGKDNVTTAVRKLALVNALRAKNLNAVT